MESNNMQHSTEGDKRVLNQHSSSYTTPYQTVQTKFYRPYSNQQHSHNNTKHIRRYYTLNVLNKHFTSTLNFQPTNELVFNDNTNISLTESNLLISFEKLKKVPITYSLDQGFPKWGEF